MPVLPLSSCVTPGNILNISELQFLFQVGLNDEMCGTLFTGFWREFKERTASNAWASTYSKCSIKYKPGFSWNRVKHHR